MFRNLIVPYGSRLLPSGTLNLQFTDTKRLAIVYQDTQLLSRWNFTNPALTSGSTGSLGNTRFAWRNVKPDTIIYDPNNLFSLTASIYTSPTTQKIAQKLKITIGKMESGIFYTTGSPTYSSLGDDVRLWVLRETKFNGETASNFSATASFSGLWENFTGGINWGRFNFSGVGYYSFRNNPQNLTYQFNNTTNLHEWQGVIETDLQADPRPLGFGERVVIVVGRGNVLWSGVPGTTGTLTEIYNRYENISVEFIFDDTIAVEGGYVVMKNTLPNIKQKDFLSNLIKMFNLYIEPSRGSTNNFIIEPRDDYYNNYQVIKNWTNKLDISQDINYEITSNIQKRTQLFTYKQDTDYYNKTYVEQTNNVFGQFKFEFDNDFTGDENKIELMFSPTPVSGILNSNNMYAPIVAQYQGGSFQRLNAFLPKILYTKTITLLNDTYKLNNITQTSYQYAGFSDDPINPNLSLNFGPINSFINNYVETQNNLYNIYWRNTTDELNSPNSKVITAYFYLDSNDINEFRFSDLIYCEINNMADYYRVIKIIDYDPSKNLPTKVELLKSTNYNLGNDGNQNNNSCFSLATTRRDFSNAEFSDWLESIRFYANTTTPYLLFYNTYNNNIIYYPNAITQSTTLQDIANYFENNPTSGFIFYYPEDDVNYISFTMEIPCTSNVDFITAMGTTTSSIINSIPINIYSLSEINTIGGRQQITGFVRQPLRNENYFGILSTSPDNIIQASNVVVTGEDNYVFGSNNIVIGNDNRLISDNNILLGNSIDNQNESDIPSVLIGNNITNQLEGSFVFGNNVTLAIPVEPDGSTAYNQPNNVMVFGNNISLTQSYGSDTFYIGSSTVEVNTNNFITNVTGTSSFNKMMIGDLTIRDDVNYDPQFIFDQYDPIYYPNGSNLYFNKISPGLQIVYEDNDFGIFNIIRYNTSNNTEQNIQYSDNSLNLGLDDPSNSVQSNYEITLDNGGNWAQYKKTYADPASSAKKGQIFRQFSTVTSTSNVLVNTQIENIVDTFVTVEANIIGIDVNTLGASSSVYYFSKKIASYNNGIQIGTTKTLVENTDLATYSVDLNVNGNYANLAVSAGATQTIYWDLQCYIY